MSTWSPGALPIPAPVPVPVVIVDVQRVSESCGWGVPVMDLVEDRDLLQVDKKGPEGMDSYRALKDASSIDGLPGL